MALKQGFFFFLCDVEDGHHEIGVDAAEFLLLHGLVEEDVDDFGQLFLRRLANGEVEKFLAEGDVFFGRDARENGKHLVVQLALEFLRTPARRQSKETTAASLILIFCMSIVVVVVVIVIVAFGVAAASFRSSRRKCCDVVDKMNRGGSVIVRWLLDLWERLRDLRVFRLFLLLLELIVFLFRFALFFFEVLFQLIGMPFEVFDALQDHVVVFGAADVDGRDVALGEEQRGRHLLLVAVDGAMEMIFPVAVDEIDDAVSSISAQGADVMAQRHELGNGVNDVIIIFIVIILFLFFFFFFFFFILLCFFCEATRKWSDFQEDSVEVCHAHLVGEGG